MLSGGKGRISTFKRQSFFFFRFCFKVSPCFARIGPCFSTDQNKKGWDAHLCAQTITDLPRGVEETSCSESAKCLLRQQEAGVDDERNLETEDGSQRPYLDKLDFEKKAIHLMCPGAFSP